MAQLSIARRRILGDGLAGQLYAASRGRHPCWLEAAIFQGLSPSEQIFNAQVGLVQHGPWLLTTGFINWSTRGSSPQPFLEAGYYTPEDKWMAGPIRVRDQTLLLLGWAHDFNETWRFQLDYQSGNASAAFQACTIEAASNTELRECALNNCV